MTPRVSDIATALASAGFPRAIWQNQGQSRHVKGYTEGFRIKPAAGRPGAHLVDHVMTSLSYSLAEQAERAAWHDRYTASLTAAGFAVTKEKTENSLAEVLVITGSPDHG